MTIKEMHSWFDILQAKGLHIEFTSREKDHILNRAQIKFVNEVLQKKYLPSLKENEKAELVYSVTESVISGYDYIYPLLGMISVTPSSGGAAYFSSMNSTINTVLGTTGNKIMTILSVSDKDNLLPLRYVNGHDRYKQFGNVYRAPKDYDAVYQIDRDSAGNYINIDPNSVTNGGTKEFRVHFIREPRPMLYSTNGPDRVHCELPEATHDEIMAIALDDAGVATRDDALMKLNTANKDNLTESM